MNRPFAVAATTLFTIFALVTATVSVTAAPTTPNPSAPAVKPVPVAPQIGGLPTRPLDLNRVAPRPDRPNYDLHPLLATDELAQPGGACYGMITCCNSEWVQGCDVPFFENICLYYGGEIVFNYLSDGSTNYECHYPE